MKRAHPLLLPGVVTASVSVLSLHLKPQLIFEPNASRVCTESRLGAHEHNLLPATPTLPDEISFATDWDAVPTGGWGGEQVMDRCRIQADGFLTWHRKIAVRVEVQPSDDPLRLGANSERAEMLMMQRPDRAPITKMIKAEHSTMRQATTFRPPGEVSNCPGQASIQLTAR